VVEKRHRNGVSRGRIPRLKGGKEAGKKKKESTEKRDLDEGKRQSAWAVPITAGKALVGQTEGSVVKQPRMQW